MSSRLYGLVEEVRRGANRQTLPTTPVLPFVGDVITREVLPRLRYAQSCRCASCMGTPVKSVPDEADELTARSSSVNPHPPKKP